MNFYIFLISWSFHVLRASGERRCSGRGLGECKENETCSNQKNLTTWLCECKKLYHFVNDSCIPNDPPTSTVAPPQAIHSAFATFFFMMILFFGLAGTVVFFARRHRWIERLHAFRIRRYNTVFVSTTANVDDDAPIS